MKVAITSAMSMLFVTFVSVIFVNVMSYHHQLAKVHAYHYASVNELESSEFASSVIDAITNRTTYRTEIKNVSLKEDFRIYEVRTKATLYLPVFGYKQEYIKESTAR